MSCNCTKTALCPECEAKIPKGPCVHCGQITMGWVCDEIKHSVPGFTAYDYTLHDKRFVCDDHKDISLGGDRLGVECVIHWPDQETYNLWHRGITKRS